MPEPPFVAIAHIQLAMPKGAEDAARLFYRDLLGMIEIPKPPELAKRGGVWFQSGPVQIHLGVEEDFRPARKAQRPHHRGWLLRRTRVPRVVRGELGRFAALSIPAAAYGVSRTPDWDNTAAA